MSMTLIYLSLTYTLSEINIPQVPCRQSSQLMHLVAWIIAIVTYYKYACYPKHARYQIPGCLSHLASQSQAQCLTPPNIVCGLHNIIVKQLLQCTSCSTVEIQCGYCNKACIDSEWHSSRAYIISGIMKKQ